MAAHTISDFADLPCCPQFDDQVSVDISAESQEPISIVKTCLDNYDIGESEVQRCLILELDYLELQNKLLCRQIELLEKSQAYHYVPGNDSEVLPAV